MRFRLIALAVLCLALLAAQADEKSYAAERYDVRLQVLEDGSMWVEEEVVLYFKGGPFTYFYRSLEHDYTDGTSDFQAWLDGQPMEAGTSPGQLEIEPGDSPILTWHFAPTTDAAHTFTLRYRAWGVVRPEVEGPRLWWYAIPPDHAYTIEQALVSLAYPPAAVVQGVDLDWEHTQQPGNPWVLRLTKMLYADTSLILEARFAAGSLAVPMPAWMAAEAQRPRLYWSSVLPGVLGMLLMLVAFVAWRQRALARRLQLLTGRVEPRSTPPGDLPPVLVGRLVFNRVEPVAGLFDLAQRGFVRFNQVEEPASNASKFLVQPCGRIDQLADHERHLLMQFPEGFQMIQPSAQWYAEYQEFLADELVGRGLIQPVRVTPRRSSQWEGADFLLWVGLLLGFCLVTLAWEFSLPEAWMAPWRIGLVAGGCLLFGACAAVLLHSQLNVRSLRYTPEGYRTAQAWRAFAAHLQQVLRARGGRPNPALFERYLPYAAAFGWLKPWVRGFAGQANLPVPGFFQPALGNLRATGFDPAQLLAAAASLTFIAWRGSSTPSPSDRVSDGGGWGGGDFGGGGGASGGGGSGAG